MQKPARTSIFHAMADVILTFAVFTVSLLASGPSLLHAQGQRGGRAPGGDTRGANHLLGTKSQYLLRAVQQPVEWYPWGREAFAKAKELNRPVLLDVGATWCKWCDLMDKESYTQPEVAAFINANFVAVKVDFDADERLSARLQQAQAYVNLPGGLPLTVFVTPDGKLYTGGSYFPPNATRAKPAFGEELRQALHMYRTNDAALQEAFDLEINKELK